VIMRAPRFILGLVAACSSRGEQQSPPSSSLSQPQPGPAFDASAARIDTPDAALPWFMRRLAEWRRARAGQGKEALVP